MKRLWLIVLTIALTVAITPARAAVAPLFWKVWNVWNTTTVSERLAQYGDLARGRLAPHFQRAGLCYPPRHVTLLGLKAEKRLEVYAGDGPDHLRLVRAYPIFAASGQAGPKLKEGDRQVPEGIYRVTALNPNSLFHLALRLGYPNTFDQEMAKREGRQKLGGDIMIHGRNVSTGCLAMGDPAVEELFVLAADTGLEQVRVVIAPADLRTARMPQGRYPAWGPKLYAALHDALADLPLAHAVTRVAAAPPEQCRQPLHTAGLLP